MNLASVWRQPVESWLPRRAKSMLLLVMVLLIFSLLLTYETSNSTPFLYVGF